MKKIFFWPILLTSAVVLIFITCKKDSVQSWQQGNYQPVAEAGADQVIRFPADSVQLSGLGTDSDGAIKSYRWNKVSGPSSFTITNADDSSTKVKNLVEGEYEFELKVTDDGGRSDTDTVIIVVLDSLFPSNCGSINAYLIPVGPPYRGGNPVAAAGNKILFFGGGSAVSIYDISTNTWTEAELSISRQSMAIGSVMDKVFFAGGVHVTGDSYDNYIFTETSRVDIYNAGTNEWSIAELSEPRELFAAASAGNKILFAGGVSPNGPSTRVDIYDVSTNAWSTAFLSEARSSLSATALGDKIYFAGGIFSTPPSNPGFSKRIDIYDVSTNSWSASSLTCEGKAQVASIAAGNKIFWAGGSISFEPLSSDKVEIRDLVTGASTCVQFCNQYARGYDVGDAVLKDSKLVFYQGYAGIFDVYDMSTDRWYMLQLNKQIRSGGIICVNNKIYVSGGGINGLQSDQVWLLEF